MLLGVAHERPAMTDLLSRILDDNVLKTDVAMQEANGMEAAQSLRRSSSMQSVACSPMQPMQSVHDVRLGHCTHVCCGLLVALSQLAARVRALDEPGGHHKSHTVIHVAAANLHGAHHQAHFTRQESGFATS